MVLVESRRYPRVSANNSVRIWSPLLDDAHVVGTLEQLSVGGCLCKTELGFEKGRVLTFKIDCEPRELVAVGEVIYRRLNDENTAYECGVRFEYISDDDREHLSAMITQALGNAA